MLQVNPSAVGVSMSVTADGGAVGQKGGRAGGTRPGCPLALNMGAKHGGSRGNKPGWLPSGSARFKSGEALFLLLRMLVVEGGGSEQCP